MNLLMDLDLTLSLRICFVLFVLCIPWNVLDMQTQTSNTSLEGEVSMLYYCGRIAIAIIYTHVNKNQLIIMIR